MRLTHFTHFQPLHARTTSRTHPAATHARLSRLASSKRRNTFADSVSVSPMALMRIWTRSATFTASGKDSHVQKRKDGRKYPNSFKREIGNRNEEPTVSSSINLNELSGFIVSFRQKSIMWCISR